MYYNKDCRLDSLFSGGEEVIPYYKKQLESEHFITVPVYNEDTKEITSVPQKIDSYVMLPNNKL